MSVVGEKRAVRPMAGDATDPALERPSANRGLRVWRCVRAVGHAGGR